MAKSFDVTLLGGFRVSIEGREVPKAAWKHRRAGDLVKLLALAPNRRLHREQVMDALWPDLDPGAAAANVRKATHLARRALGLDNAVSGEDGVLVLLRDGTGAIDAERFETEARAAAEAADAAACAAAARLYHGDLLPEDRYAEWTIEPRERLRALYAKILRTAEMWDPLLEVDRADEEAHRELMRLHIAAGNRHGAMRQFERLRQALHDELGVSPDADSVSLYEKVLAMEGHEAPTPAERVRALLAWGLVHWNRKDLEEAERTAEEARALAVEAGLGRELGEASALLGLVSHARGTWRDMFRTEFVASVERSPELASFVFDAQLCFSEFHLYGVDGHEETRPFAGELLAVAEGAGSLQGRALATLMLGEVELLSGRWDPAEAELSRAADLHEEAGAIGGQSLSLERLAEAATARGRRWQARRLLGRARRLAEAGPLAPHLVARTYGAMIEAADTPERRVAIVHEGEKALEAGDVCEPCSMSFRVGASKTYAEAGTFEPAERHLEQAERIAGMWQGGPWLAAVWEARAVLRRAQGDEALSTALFREAADLFARAGRPVDEHRCRSEAAARPVG
jgi:DNA-binding SARP family transcriptional activator